MSCDHEWKVEYIGLTGSGYTEEKCIRCGSERVCGLVPELLLEIAALKASRAQMQSADKPQ